MPNFLPRIKGHVVVGGVGPKRPKLILVGESLGATEVAEGVPFVGVDGRILDQLLSHAGIKREECYTTNIVKVRPPMDKVIRLKEIGLTISDFIPILHEELSQLEPSSQVPTIVSIGNLSTAVLTSMGMKPTWTLDSTIYADGILKKWRGSIYDSTFDSRFTVIPTIHPGAVREMWSLRGTVIADLRKAVRVSEGKRIIESFDTIIGSTSEIVEQWISLILAHCKEVSIDIEVLGSLQIACVGFGFYLANKRHSLCIPLKYGLRNYWENRNDEFYVWGQMRRIWHSRLLKITQYGWYDYSMLRPFLGEPAPPWYDLFVAHHTIDPELPHTLAYMTSIYTDIPYYKDDPKDDDKTWGNMTSSEVLWRYNGMDVEGPLVIRRGLDADLQSMNMTDFFQGFAMPKVRAIWRMSQRGLLVDTRRQSILLRWKQRQLRRLTIKLNVEVGHDILATSPQQIKKYLYEELNLPVQYEKKTRKPTTNEKALEKLNARYNLPQLDLILEIRGLIKSIGTYLGFTLDSHGRAKGGYNPAGTETGRSSCKKFFDKSGLDLQNVPSEYRSMFVVPEGKIYLKRDLWQAEAYVVAVLSKAQQFLAKLRRHEKVHTMVGEWIYSKPAKELTPEEYLIAKKTVHGSNYRMGPNTFAVFLKKPVAIAKRIQQIYYQFAPEISAWHKTIESEVTSKGMLITPFGRKRIFRGRFDDDTFREAFADIPQGTIGDYNHLAMMKFEYSYNRHAQIVQEGFDSLLFECDKEVKDEVNNLIDWCYKKTLYHEGEFFEIPNDAEEGRSWGKGDD